MTFIPTTKKKSSWGTFNMKPSGAKHYRGWEYYFDEDAPASSQWRAERAGGIRMNTNSEAGIKRMIDNKFQDKENDRLKDKKHRADVEDFRKNESMNEGNMKVTIEKADGEYRVPAEDGYENGAHYTDDKEDAIAVAKKVFGDDVEIKFRSVPEFVGGKYEKYRPKKESLELDEGNTYIAFYKGKQMEVDADSSYAAQKLAAEKFKAKKSYEVTVKLASKDGKEVKHVATESNIDKLLTILEHGWGADSQRKEIEAHRKSIDALKEKYKDDPAKMKIINKYIGLNRGASEIEEILKTGKDTYKYR